jgi:hypothetical protein
VGNLHAHQAKLTVADLERLSGAARGAPAAHFDTAYLCKLCGTIYSFQSAVSFMLLGELHRSRSLRQSWEAIWNQARVSVSRPPSLLNRAPFMRSDSSRRRLAARELAVDRMEAGSLTARHLEGASDSTAARAIWEHGDWFVMANWKL